MRPPTSTAKRPTGQAGIHRGQTFWSGLRSQGHGAEGSLSKSEAKQVGWDIKGSKLSTIIVSEKSKEISNKVQTFLKSDLCNSQVLWKYGVRVQPVLRALGDKRTVIGRYYTLKSIESLWCRSIAK